jgi:hypothetical protein
MLFYSTIQRVIISAATISKAREFANNVVATTNYSDSNQYSLEKIKQDHFISKVGEEAARIVLAGFAVVSGPDYGIYAADRKSWDDDLYVHKTGISVKTQKKSVAAKYGLSWTFQCSVTRSDIILKKPDAWVVFVEFDDLSRNICFVYPPYQIKELTFGQPVLQKLKGHKKVVYANTLPCRLIN